MKTLIRSTAVALVAIVSLTPSLVAADSPTGASVGQESLEVIVLPAFGTTGAEVLIEGRVVEQKPRSEIDPSDGKRRNLKRNLKLLVNREVADMPVNVTLGAERSQALTDAEGYFRVSIARTSELVSGWHIAAVEAGGFHGSGAVLLVGENVKSAIISDVDDTLLVTGVTSKRRLLKNSLLRNHLQREPVARMPALLRRLTSESEASGALTDCCIFYLSSTPKQLHSALQGFLEHNDFPRGVLITKRVTGDSTSEGMRDHKSYKLSRLEDIFTRLPHVSFTLLGDDAEADPEIYAEIARRYPERVRGVWIREASGRASRTKYAGQGNLADLLAHALDCSGAVPSECVAR